MPKFLKTEKIEVRIENSLLERIPEQGRNRWINDACREKLDGLSPAAAAATMGRLIMVKCICSQLILLYLFNIF